MNVVTQSQSETHIITSMIAHLRYFNIADPLKLPLPLFLLVDQLAFP